MEVVAHLFNRHLTTLAIYDHEARGGDDAESRKETVKRPAETDCSPAAQLMSSHDSSCVFRFTGAVSSSGSLLTFMSYVKLS